MTRPSARTNLIAGVIAVCIAGVAVFLILTGGDTDTAESASSGALNLETRSQEAIEEASGLSFPDSTEDFLTSQQESGGQMDVTFTMAPDDLESFLVDSGFEEGGDAQNVGERVITHSSPLWKLNPEGEISSVVGRYPSGGEDAIGRSIEFVAEDGRIRVRIVLVDLSEVAGS